MTDDRAATATSLMHRTEQRRTARSALLDAANRSDLGQYFTPAIAARLIAGFATLPSEGELRILDPGAGVGSLTAAVVSRVVVERPDLKLRLTTFEVDPVVNADLTETLLDCARAHPANIEQYADDFIAWAVEQIKTGVPVQYDLIVMNPPYRKIASDSRERAALTRVGIKATNLYTAFVALALRLLPPGGQLVAITPRSFANGSYFKTFRHDLFARAALRHIHVFGRRDTVFADSDVLQENVIFLLEAGAEPNNVVISSSRSYVDAPVTHTVPFKHVVSPNDPEKFIHIATDPADLRLAAVMAELPSTLNDLRISVSTGRVVDFRTHENLRTTASLDDAPLIYPNHMCAGHVRWPLAASRKPNGLAVNDSTRSMLLPSGTYVLVKRFTAKEEPRRVAASLLTAADVTGPFVAIENHVNVYHQENAGLPDDVGAGLTAYLNSSFVDRFVRLFSGHTQINAGDLRSLRYPSLEQLARIGASLADRIDVGEVDAAVHDVLLPLSGVRISVNESVGPLVLSASQGELFKLEAMTDRQH